MPHTDDWLWWLLAVPLLGSATCGVLHFLTLRARARSAEAAGPAALAWPVAAGAMAVGLALSLMALSGLTSLEPSARVLESSAWQWIDTGRMAIAMRPSAAIVGAMSTISTFPLVPRRTLYSTHNKF